MPDTLDEFKFTKFHKPAQCGVCKKVFVADDAVLVLPIGPDPQDPTAVAALRDGKKYEPLYALAHRGCTPPRTRDEGLKR